MLREWKNNLNGITSYASHLKRKFFKNDFRKWILLAGFSFLYSSSASDENNPTKTKQKWKKQQEDKKFKTGKKTKKGKMGRWEKNGEESCCNYFSSRNIRGLRLRLTMWKECILINFLFPFLFWRKVFFSFLFINIYY